MPYSLSHIDLPSAVPRFKRSELFALCARAPQGKFAELGVYRGGTAWLYYQVAHQRGCELHLFDTFCGIPEASYMDTMKKGDLADADLPALRAHMPDAHLHIGVFPETLPADLTGFSFVHIDCDQYATCEEAIAAFWPRLVPGGILAFDDYPEFSGIRSAVDWAFPEGLTTTETGVAYATKGTPYQGARR